MANHVTLVNHVREKPRVHYGGCGAGVGAFVHFLRCIGAALALVGLAPSLLVSP